MKHVITGATIFDGQQMLSQHSLVLENQRIHSIISNEQIDSSLTSTQLRGGTLSAGFIDLQVNGGGGLLLNNAATPNTIKTMLKAHRSKGVCAMLPTVITDTRAITAAAIDAVRTLRQQQYPGVLGLHIEGPFFNPQRRGVHQQDHIRKLSTEDIDWLCNQADIPIMLTLAPEQTEAGQIKALSEAGIIVCAGHTDALAADIERAFAEGLQGFTHLFNAMRPMSSREPGVVGAALADNDSYCGIIVDGHHNHPSTVLVAHKAKAAGHLYLVSDAMATIGSDNKTFELYGETITEKEGCLFNSENRLAGSAIGLIDAVKISHQTVGLPLDECLKMASLYPARFIQQQQHFGHISSGLNANLVHFDDDFQVTHSWVNGDMESHPGTDHLDNDQQEHNHL
ncbi:N-acetylglucosamine-6-phosphate deacetylase [Oceanicoccus sp. KOV_DT_Chl]|uniref:N-acetylglucosamine-6-phosphate deacetylase n=1 Tax=Oceanicoccus sp. KOV_DT_Chl TaxID=1904639 RepID=UPI000C7D6225|nr:N-acetylglucosamine-6-phosphate deacetylase [Oceanicoccus sp. KOV_DT_Chl]